MQLGVLCCEQLLILIIAQMKLTESDKNFLLNKKRASNIVTKMTDKSKLKKCRMTVLVFAIMSWHKYFLDFIQEYLLVTSISLLSYLYMKLSFYDTLKFIQQF